MVTTALASSVQSPPQFAVHVSSEAAKRVRQKLEQRLADGARNVEAVLDQVARAVPDDYLVPAAQAAFPVVNDKLRLELASDRYAIHDHALGQLAQRVEIPAAYIHLLAEQQPELLALNLAERYRHNQNGTRYLARIVDGELRGWLSSKFKRIDSQPIIAAFVQAATSFGAVPVEGHCLDTKVSLKWMLPQVFEPIPDEVLGVGVHLRNSDFGDGALSIRLFIERIVCTNGMTCEEGLRKVHLGARLDDLEFSAETQQLELRTLVSATRDVVGSLFAPDAISGKMALIAEANRRQIPIKQTIEALRLRSRLTKAEAGQCLELATVNDVELLPPLRERPKRGHTTAWRLANVLGALAHEAEPARALELQDLAGQLSGVDQAAGNNNL